MNLQTDLFLEPPFGDFTDVIAIEEDIIRGFRNAVYAYFGEYGRDFPWRRTHDPYEILVSEIMLQQTQTGRVEAKYLRFLEMWPDFKALASASLAEVYRAWQGLGYNRRAKALVDIARIVVGDMGGRLSDSFDALLELPMVGHATAAAVSAFAFNKAFPYLETNIRRVYIYFFFDGRVEVRDPQLLRVVEQTLDTEDPRQWYYALMDYGVYLKSAIVNPNRRSAHYTIQSSFEGSDRQIRGGILRHLSESEGNTIGAILAALPYEESRIRRCVGALAEEGFLVKEESIYRIGD